MSPPPEDILPGSASEPGAPEDLTSPAVPPEAEKGRPGSFFKELPILILIAFGLALLIKTFFLQAFYIPSESMMPTLQIQDRVLVNKLVYRFRAPRRGEIIVFVSDEAPKPKRSFLQRVRSFLFEGLGVTAPSERDFIKRVIALPGEKIQVHKGKVTITPVGADPFVLDEPYVAAAVDDEPFGPFTVPPDSYFVMGDNRPNSSDSRSQLGAVSKDEIIGKAFVRIWPLGRIDGFRTPKYLPAGGRAGPGVSSSAWSPMAG